MGKQLLSRDVCGSSGPRRLSRVVLVAISVVGVAATAHGQTVRTWNSNGTSNVAWLTTTNWLPSGTFAGNAPNATVTGEGATTDIMAFASGNTGATAGIDMNTLSGLLSLGGINFARTSANAFQIGNSSNTVSGTLQLNGASINSVANTLIRADSGNLTITNVATGATDGGQTLGLRLGITNGIFDVSSGRTLTINSVISEPSGTASGFTKTGAGTLLLAGANSYTGGATISGGRLLFANLLAMPATGTVAVSGASLGVNLGGSGEWTTGTSGNGTIGGLLAGLGGQAGSAVSWSGSSTLAVDTSNAGSSQTYSGNITNVGTSLGLSKLGSGMLVLTGSNTYSGATALGSGTLRLENTAAIAGSSSVSIPTSTTLSIGTDTAFAQGAGTALSLTAGTIVSDRATPGAGLTHAFSGTMAVSNATHNFTKGSNVTSGDAGIQIGGVTNASGAGGSATFNPTTANLIITGGYTGLTNGGLNTLIMGGAAANNAINGNITLGTRSNINVSKTGNSVWTLSGTNTALSGTLTVSGGALIATTLNALPNSGTATFNGGTIGARVGGAGWTTAEVDSFLASATKTSGALGIDTTNADLTQWTAFTTTNFGSTLGLTKLGTGKLTLNSASNNYTGTTLVSQGTLEMTVDHALSGTLTFGYPNGTTSATGTLALNNVNASFGGLTVDGNSSTPYGIRVDAGKTITVGGAVQIGASTPGVAGTITSLNMTGGGEFVHNGSDFIVGGGTSTTVSATSTLDLTGLSKATITTTGNFRIAPNVGSVVASQATLLLPTPVVSDTVATTIINVGAGASRGLSVGNGGSGGVGTTYKNTLELGTGLTTINTPFINIGSNPVSGNLRDVGQLIYGQAAGDLIIRGADGTSRAGEINLGVVNVGSFPQTTGASSPTVPVLFDTSGHDADILATSLNMGAGLNRTAAQDHIFRFGAQTTGVGVGSLASKLDVTNVNLGNRSAGNSSTATQTFAVDLSGGTVTFGNAGATGTGVDIGNSAYDQAGAATFNSQLNISGGNVTIHNGTGGFAVRLGSASSAANGGTMNNSMNLTGGTTTLGGDIVRGTVAGGTVNSTVLLSGGNLEMNARTIGSGTLPITFTAESGTLKDLGELNGGGTLTKTTSGTLTMLGTNTYTGTTAVNAGRLLVNGTNSGGAAYTVAPGAILGGRGSIGASAFIINGTLAPGASIESLLGGELNLNAGSTFDYELNSSVLDGDLLRAAGDVNLTGSVTLSLTEEASGVLPVGSKLTLINYSGAWNTGVFVGYADDSEFVLGSNTWRINYNDTSGGSNFVGDQTLSSYVTITVVPEPSSVALVALGMLGMLLFRKRA